MLTCCLRISRYCRRLPLRWLDSHCQSITRRYAEYLTMQYGAGVALPSVIPETNITSNPISNTGLRLYSVSRINVWRRPSLSIKRCVYVTLYVFDSMSLVRLGKIPL
jgi:hypothetical protein